MNDPVKKADPDGNFVGPLGEVAFIPGVDVVVEVSLAKGAGIYVGDRA